ncbi:PVC-type heme-binding CxxCH protein [Lacihabitans soyangensis]|uniref:Dehydrogenase n=1 Tax=Lacihabitans soyangensis TaxID=869394 RepID=A0AAE3H2T4_9BACT|nr:PVC-type heme-binding CxxCH protein [Lacihabitans soyangensis]MCP9762931.1 dehydrogenase [Lacihabitans soyangensis]
MIKKAFGVALFLVSGLFFAFTVNPNLALEEEPLKFYLPDDLKIELWAESSMLYNPTNMDTDIKGRIWVTEGVNYRNFNNDSSAFYHHEKGDRIVILTDTDQDGKADKSQVFVQDKDLVAPLGIAVFGKDIIVSCAPYLIKYTDENGDDIPDSKEIILKGFGGFNHDHSLHSVVAGPDGKWHFSVGNAGPHVVTDKSGFTLRSGSIYTGGSPYNEKNQGNMVSDDGKTWVGGLQMRINPDMRGLKVRAHNFRNSYETYIDGHGEMWQNDNDDQVVTCRVSWLAEGGDAGFFSKDGRRYWNADQRPGQNMFTAHWHQEDPAVMPAGDNSGAGSPTGMLRIEGNSLGQKYQGMVLSADAGRNVLFGYMPKIKNSFYDLKNKKQVFVSSSFTDDPAYQWNNSNFQNDLSKWFRPSDLMIGTDGALYIADWYDAVVGGHRIQDQKAYGRIYRISPKNSKLNTPILDLSTAKGQIECFKNPAIHVKYQAYLKLKQNPEANLEAVLKLLQDTNPFIKSRAIWLLATMGAKGESKTIELLKTGNEQEKVVALRALRQNMNEEKLFKFLQNLTKDPSAFVRREAILALQPFSYEKSKSTFKQFADTSPINDSFYTNALAFVFAGKENDFFKENSLWFNKHFDLAFAMYPSSALNYFEKIALISNELFEKRKRAITAIGFIKSKEAVGSMLKLAESKDKRLADMAKYWLSFRSTNDWFDLHNWNSISDEIQLQKVLSRLLGRKEIVLNGNIAFGDRRNAAIEMLKSTQGSQMLLEMIQNQTLSEDLMEYVGPLLSNHSESTIKYQAKNLINTFENSYNSELVTKTKGNIENGKKVFESNCSSCHKIGNSGKEIGPELTKIGSKLEKKGLYEALVYPSASLVFGYETYSIDTKNGNTYFGFLIAENDKLLTVKDLSGKIITIQQKEIKSKAKQKKSVMPTAYSLAINETELTDLIEYLTKQNQ